MGLGNSALRKEEQRLLQDFRIIQEVREGEEWVLQEHASQQIFLLKAFLTEEDEQQERLEQQLERKIKSPNENLLGLSDFKSINIGSKAQPNFKLYAIFQFSELSLAQQITSRAQEKRFFDQKQLMSIFCSSALALKHLNSSEQSHGTVSTQNIFLSEQGIVKLIDPIIGRIPLASPQQGLFLSPEVLSCIQDNQQRQVDGVKVDVFSLGMCLIQAALLQPSLECYNYETMEIDFQLLNDKLQRVSHSYSQRFSDMLRNMLEENYQDRPDIEDLEACLQTLAQEQVQQMNMVEAEAMLPDRIDKPQRLLVVSKLDHSNPDPQELNTCRNNQLQDQQQSMKEQDSPQVRKQQNVRSSLMSRQNLKGNSQQNRSAIKQPGRQKESQKKESLKSQIISSSPFNLQQRRKTAMKQQQIEEFIAVQEKRQQVKEFNSVDVGYMSQINKKIKHIETIINKAEGSISAYQSQKKNQVSVPHSPSVACSRPFQYESKSQYASQIINNYSTNNNYVSNQYTANQQINPPLHFQTNKNLQAHTNTLISNSNFPPYGIIPTTPSSKINPPPQVASIFNVSCYSSTPGVQSLIIHPPNLQLRTMDYQKPGQVKPIQTYGLMTSQNRTFIHTTVSRPSVYKQEEPRFQQRTSSQIYIDPKANLSPIRNAAPQFPQTYIPSTFTHHPPNLYYPPPQAFAKKVQIDPLRGHANIPTAKSVYMPFNPNAPLVSIKPVDNFNRTPIKQSTTPKKSQPGPIQSHGWRLLDVKISQSQSCTPIKPIERYPTTAQDQLFTDPRLLEMVRKDLEKIEGRGRGKENRGISPLLR